MSVSSAQNGIFACKIRKARASQAASAGNDHFATQQNDFRYQTAASIRKLIRIKGGRIDAAVHCTSRRFCCRRRAEGVRAFHKVALRVAPDNRSVRFSRRRSNVHLSSEQRLAPKRHYHTKTSTQSKRTIAHSYGCNIEQT